MFVVNHISMFVKRYAELNTLDFALYLFNVLSLIIVYYFFY